ncbi:MAG: 3-methyl-2-oxobutanoate hydroxymethyltransferase [Desulfovibrio sp.]|nr:3-methyl-2-oxobutanoate hydroxymethyltransferase [Desulfovibrio sp.]
MKNTPLSFRAAKGRQKLAMLTCYDYSMARLMADTGLDALLVGDSLGMVMLGYEDTVSVTLEEMIQHCAAVARGAGDCLVVCDMPFLSSQCGVEDTVRNAGKLVKEGRAQAVKLEGGAAFAPEIAALVRASIPVMGHIGLTPQSVNCLGGFKVQARDLEAASTLLSDAVALEKAGAFALVLECVPDAVAAMLTATVSIPVIGIGAGPHCDGQVLVWQDMLNVTGRKPKFVRAFADVGDVMRQAFADYKSAVASGAFPADAESYHMDPDIARQLASRAKA